MHAGPEKTPLVLGEDQRTIGRDVSDPKLSRRARRLAKRGIKPADDQDPADMLVSRGVDVLGAASQRPVILSDSTKPVLKTSAPRLDPMSDTFDLPDPEERQREIARIQQDLVSRRRRRLAILLAKLAFFVLLPTFLVGWYYYFIATPLYVTHTEFVIQKASPGGAASGVSSLLSGSPLATAQDSIIVQGYLTSREAMLRLDKDHGFRKHFSDPTIDALRRLPPNASDEVAYSVYRDMVVVGFDPTEGVLRMEVVAATSAASQNFANALVGYAEERVDQLSQRAREDQMRGSTENYDKAETNLRAAQQHLVDLQGYRGVLSTEVEVTSQMTIINSMELEMEKKKLELQEILSNPSPNQTRAELMRADIKRLDERIATLRGQMTENTQDSTSLAKIAGELKLAETEVATRQLLLQQAVGEMESARMEANRQVRYLAMGVTPVAPDVPTLPRKLENTLLSFVIFGGLYLLVSLTVSILREQVSV